MSMNDWLSQKADSLKQTFKMVKRALGLGGFYEKIEKSIRNHFFSFPRHMIISFQIKYNK